MTSPTSTMRAWQYTNEKGDFIENLKLNPSAPYPVPKDPSNEHVVQIISTALNPADYKILEGLTSYFIPKPATPGIDFVGKIITPAKDSNLRGGETVHGYAGTSPFSGIGGALAEYSIARKECVVPLPKGLKTSDAPTLGVAAVTAYQTIAPFVKSGDRVFINGGSGGTGVFSIQIAKLLGCHVTTSCSTGNVELCKSLGADEVIDYRQGDVLTALKSGAPFDRVIDNVGADESLYWKAHEYTTKSAKFVSVAGAPSFSYLIFVLKAKLWPTFLGGGARVYESFLMASKPEDLEKVGTLMAEGKLKAIIDERFPFEQASEAFKKLRSGRAKGKIVVDVASSDGASP
jgi:NADPH:quinone reductase-like Zn-dependent oxidoreductase